MPIDVKVPGPSLYRDAEGRLVDALNFGSSDMVEFSAQGGGFVQAVSRAAFEQTFRPATFPQPTPATVTAEWLPEDLQLPAYTTGRRWNGWAVPYFEVEVGLRLLEWLPNLSYDSTRDAFIAQPYDEEGEAEVFAAETLSVAGRPVKAYPIGAGSWTWELAEGEQPGSTD